MTGKTPPAAGTSYDRIVAGMRRVAPGPISEADAHEAARNLIAFGRLALEIRREKRHDAGHADV